MDWDSWILQKNADSVLERLGISREHYLFSLRKNGYQNLRKAISNEELDRLYEDFEPYIHPRTPRSEERIEKVPSWDEHWNRAKADYNINKDPFIQKNPQYQKDRENSILDFNRLYDRAVDQGRRMSATKDALRDKWLNDFLHSSGDTKQHKGWMARALKNLAEAERTKWQDNKNRLESQNAPIIAQNSARRKELSDNEAANSQIEARNDSRRRNRVNNANREDLPMKIVMASQMNKAIYDREYDVTHHLPNGTSVSADEGAGSTFAKWSEKNPGRNIHDYLISHSGEAAPHPMRREELDHASGNNRHHRLTLENAAGHRYDVFVSPEHFNSLFDENGKLATKYFQPNKGHLLETNRVSPTEQNMGIGKSRGHFTSGLNLHKKPEF